MRRHFLLLFFLAIACCALVLVLWEQWINHSIVTFFFSQLSIFSFSHFFLNQKIQSTFFTTLTAFLHSCSSSVTLHSLLRLSTITDAHNRIMILNFCSALVYSFPNNCNIHFWEKKKNTTKATKTPTHNIRAWIWSQNRGRKTLNHNFSSRWLYDK